MSDNQISLDEWVNQTAGTLQSREREALNLFQQDWTEGHRTNPLVYPLAMNAATWQDNFEWFMTVEFFGLSEEEIQRKAVKPKPSKPMRHGADAPTVVFDQTPESENMETVIMDGPIRTTATQAAPEPVLGAGGELDDLGTLIMEHQEAESESETVQEAPAEHEGTVIMEAEPAPVEPTPQAPQPASGGDAVGDLDDLDTLVLEDRAKEDDAPKKAKPQAPAPTEPEKESAPKAKAAPAKKAPEKEAAPKKKTPSKKEAEAGLDLDDLDTMEWMEE